MVVWDKSIHGDLSGDRLNPTPITLGAGTSSIIATSVAGDREYVRLPIPAGMTLSGLIHATWASADLLAFIAVQEGPVFTEPPAGTNVAALLGWTHFGPGAATVGADILPLMGEGPGTIGFVPPLPGGRDYTYWIQQTGPVLTHYQLDFVVTASCRPDLTTGAVPGAPGYACPTAS